MNIVEALGKLAGIGGISLGVFLLLFKEVIRKNVFPKLQDRQAFVIILVFQVLSFGVAAMGLSSYVYIATHEKQRDQPGAGAQEDPTFAENQAIELEKEIMTLVGRWDNSENSPKDKREVIEKAPGLASRMESLKDDQLRPAYRIVRAEYCAYALAMAASTSPIESELDKRTKNAYAEKAHAMAIQGLKLIQSINQASSSDSASADGIEFATRDNAVDRLKVIAVMGLCRKHDLAPTESALSEAQNLIDSVSPSFLADYPVSKNSELDCVKDPESKGVSVK